MGNAYRSVLALKPTGDAVPANVLAGKTFSNADGTGKTGTMVNNGAVSVTLTDQDPTYTIPEGYHNGNGEVTFTSSGGDGADLVVTCSDDFAGKTITCSDGTTTFTETCPSSSPYIVTFNSIPTGTWTVSGIIEGTTYSQQVVITDFDATLTAGFDYKQWVTLGGLDPTDYASLSDLFADEAAVRRLMTIHASADYLIEKIADDIDTIDDFTANDTAMKWIGLRDYVCDGLTAITGVKAKFLASQYWERYLKDHVPTMTSDIAPYGSSFSSGTYSSAFYAWKAFNNTNTGDADCWISTNNQIANTYLGYSFTNPICVKALKIVNRNSGSPAAIKNFKLQGSNDGSTWVDIATLQNPKSGSTEESVINVPNNEAYYIRYKVLTIDNYGSDPIVAIANLQFYGRSLDVSVPVMTSNTAPYGEAFGDVNITDAWKAFDSSGSSYPTGANALEHYWGYVFPSKTKVKMAMIYSSSIPTDHMYIESADSKTGTFSGEEFTATANANYTYFVDLSNVNENKAIRLRLTKSTNFGGAIGTLQFYGVDYSEKEFETGTTKKWLYDHGVELEELTTYGNGTATKESDDIILDATATVKSSGVYKNMDIAPYNMLFAILESISDYYKSGDPSVIAARCISSDGATTIATSSKTNLNPLTKIGLDVSSINQSCRVASYAYSQKAYLKEFWLE